jgi:hypothetical protein
LEQQSEELPLGQPQQERARQPEQQHRFSARLRFLVLSSKSAMAGQNWQVGICQAYPRRVQTYSGDAERYPKTNEGSIAW